jgi:hypothetical protein
MSIAIWFCTFGHAADWTDHVVPSQFVATSDFRFAGIYVRVDVDGLGPLWLQLDTGVPEALLLYGKSLPSVPGSAPLSSKSSQGRFRASGQIGEHHFRNETGLVHPNLGGRIDVATQKAGSVGVAAFDGSWLVLDLPGERVAVLDSPDETLDAATCWVDTKEEHGTHWVYVDGLGGLLFDAGSAPLGVWTKPKDFAKLTGLKPDPRLKIGSGHAFGKPITVLGAPSQVALNAGEMDLGKPLVNHVPEKQPSRRAGILGLAAFEGRVVVLDLIRERLGRFGPCASTTTQEDPPL